MIKYSIDWGMVSLFPVPRFKNVVHNSVGNLCIREDPYCTILLIDFDV